MNSTLLTLWNFIATGCFIGRARVAPGTWGTVLAFVLFILIHKIAPGVSSVEGGITLALVTALLGVLAANIVCRAGLYGKGHTDPQPIVIDEFAGSFIALAGLPVEAFPIALAFVFFRFFDVSKIFPAKQAERLPEGWGIVADDLVAGLYANLATRLALLIWGYPI